MGWWFGRKSAPADARPFVPAWLQNDAAEVGFARFLTFEIVADVGPPILGSVLTDASGGAISSDATQELVGFAAYGRSIGSALEPLVESFGIELFDDGTRLRAADDGVAVVIGNDELGNSADNEKVPRLQREQLPARSLPAALRLTYYDLDRDYQTGEARAAAGEQMGNETQQDLPVVLSAGDAKSLAQEMLARAWATRDKLTLRLPPGRAALEPGSRLDLPLNPARWTVQKTMIERFAVIAELLPSVAGGSKVAGDGGRIVPNRDIAAGAVSVALLDIPNVLGTASNDPTILIAASSPTGGWKRRSVELSFGGQGVVAPTALRKTVLGHALAVLGGGGTDLVDDQNDVDIELLDPDQWLTSCDDDSLAAGANLAVIGSELIQFGRATPLGGGKFRLSHLLRGRGGSEWACEDHAGNEVFCLIDSAALQPVTLPAWSAGAVVTATITGAAGASIDFLAEGLRPPSPVNLKAGYQATGDLELSWTRRSRQGFAWLDGVDAPIGEAREQYSVVIIGSIGSIELAADAPELIIPAPTVAGLGVGSASIEVRQIGDLAASRAAKITITIF
jgi:hypothetical protein